jgi:hypothetical protein
MGGPKPRPQHRARLRKRDNPLEYTFEDTWDAATAEELHEASYGVWLRGLLMDPRWGKPTSKTFFLSPLAAPQIEDLIWSSGKVPPGFFSGTIFARQLRGNRVIRRAYLHLFLNLTEHNAITLCYQQALAPIIWIPGPGWEGMGIPPTGPSFPVDTLNAEHMAHVLGGIYLEANLRNRPPLRLWLNSYGYNKIPEFPRLFESKKVQIPRN